MTATKLDSLLRVLKTHGVATAKFDGLEVSFVHGSDGPVADGIGFHHPAEEFVEDDDTSDAFGGRMPNLAKQREPGFRNEP